MKPFNALELDTITGFLSASEAALLYRLASEVPLCGVIIEIGSYRGKSTVALALGAKQRKAAVFAVDPRYSIGGSSTDFNMSDQAAFFHSLLAFDVADTVKVINLTSYEAHLSWDMATDSIDLMWIDGNHTHERASEDLHLWSQQLMPTGKIACHDYNNPDFPGVKRAVDEFCLQQQWHICEQVDTCAILEKTKG